MKKSLLSIAALLQANTITNTGKPRRHKKKPRPCLNQCGKRHTHNNSFCSAQCCKAYRGQA